MQEKLIVSVTMENSLAVPKKSKFVVMFNETVTLRSTSKRSGNLYLSVYSRNS